MTAGKAAVATGKAGGADSAPAVRKDKQSDIKESGRQPSVKENAAPAGAGSASAPAAAPSRGSGKPGTTAAAAGKKKGGLSDMWSRAPPKKAAAPASKGAAQPQKAAATPAVDAEAALKLNNEVICNFHFQMRPAASLATCASSIVAQARTISPIYVKAIQASKY